MDSLALTKTEFIHATQKQNKFFRCFFFQSFIFVQTESKSTKQTQVIVIWLSRVLFKRKIIGCAVLNIGLVKTAFLQPLSTSSSKAANTVKFVNCETSTLCSFFVGYKTLWRRFCWEYLLALPSRRGTQEFGSIQCVKTSQPSISFCFSIWTQKLDKLLQHILSCWTIDQACQLQLLRWSSSKHSLRFCVSHVQVQNPRGIVDISVTPL